MSRPAQDLRALLARPGCHLLPCAWDGISAALVAEAAYPAVFLSGGLVAASMGLPDLGLVTATEMLAHAGAVAAACPLPVLADLDTGFGGVLNVRRTMEAACRAGLAGAMLEDQEFPHRCGRLAGKSVVPPDEMTRRIRAARDAAGPDFVLVARTDALAPEGLPSALDRVRRCLDAGADLALIAGLRDPAHLALAAEAANGRLAVVAAPTLTQPQLAQPLLAQPLLAQHGVRLLIHPAELAQAALAAMRAALAALRGHGPMPALAPFPDLLALAGTDAALALDNSYADNSYAKDRA